MKKFFAGLVLSFCLIIPAVAMPQPVLAAGNPCTVQTVTDGTSSRKIADVPACISQVYTWSLAIAAILAMLMIVYGGYLVMTASGNAEQATEGKTAIFSAIVGMILLFSAYLILNTINPDLVQFKLGTCVKDGQEIGKDGRTIRTRQECEAAGGKIETFKPTHLPTNIPTPPPQQ